MRILVTGVNNWQIGRHPQQERFHRVDVPSSVAYFLHADGHHVEQRLVHLGEEISPDRYDLALLWLSDVYALGNLKYGALGFLWAWHEARRTRLPLALMLDDARFRDDLTNARSFRRNHRTTLYKRINGERHNVTETDDTTRRHEPQLLAALDDLTRRDLSGVVAAYPSFAWGDPAVVRDGAGLTPDAWATYDPSPLILPRMPEVERPGERERAWFLPTVQQKGVPEWVERLDLTWPVVYVGQRRLSGGRRLSERAVIQEANTRWGLLAYPHPLSGSGWWRSRYLHALHCEVVLLGPEDTRPLSDSERRLTARDVEAMTGDGLSELAAVQAKTLRSHLATTDQLRDQLAHLFAKVQG